MKKPITWLLLIFLCVSCVFSVQLGRFGQGVDINGTLFKSFIPPIFVAPEYIPGINIPNSLFTTIIVDVVILLLAWAARRGMDLANSGKAPANWFANAWESFVDYLYRNYMVPTLGARAKTVVHIAVTAFVFILVSGMMEVIPGIESVGVLEAPHKGTGYCYVAASPKIGIITGIPAVSAEACKKTGALAVGPAEEEASLASDISMAEAGGTGAVVIPFMRRPTSDLSTTLAMALVAFVFIEIQGFRANGTHYLSAFFRFGELKKVKKGMMVGLISVIQFAVGFLELLSEFIRIISFSFRLFGNMFAGTVLVLVMAFLLPVVVPVAFLALEFAVAVIQAFVFMMLIVVYTSLAVSSHGGGDEHAEAAGH